MNKLRTNYIYNQIGARLHNAEMLDDQAKTLYESIPEEGDAIALQKQLIGHVENYAGLAKRN